MSADVSVEPGAGPHFWQARPSWFSRDARRRRRSSTCDRCTRWSLGILQEKQQAPDFKGVLSSVSYAPFEGTAHPDVDNIPTGDKIRSDIKALAPLTCAIRLYSSTGGVELVPPIANEFGLKVMVGAWIISLSSVTSARCWPPSILTKHNSNVNGIVVGNETIYRGEQIPLENLHLSPEDSERTRREETQRLRDAELQAEGNKAEAVKWATAENSIRRLSKLIQRTKRSVNIPVTTGEIWNIWLEHPELASSVDFIAAHILPYWEGFSSKQAVDQALIIYQKLRDAFPGKRIVIAEFGWPSAGYNLKSADPGLFQQAATLRNLWQSPSRSAWSTTLSKPSTSPGNFSKVASVRTGAFSTRIANRNFPGAALSSMKPTGNLPASHF